MTDRHDPPRWLSFSRALVGYIGYGLGGVVFLVLLLPVSAIVGFAPTLRKKALRTIFRLYCAFLTRAYLPVLQLYRVKETSGLHRSQVHEPVVYVANHRGRLDGPLLLGVIRNTGVIIKQLYARQPVYSAFVKHLDFVNVDPGSLESLADALKRCRDLVHNGTNLLVFPEGTRAASGKLLPFRDFAFRIAIHANVPVVPVVVHSDLPFMAKIKGSHFPRRKFTYRVRFLAPVMRQENETAGELAERVRQRLATELARLDRGTVWEDRREGGT
ncbi:MAG: hypothetical protein GF418_10055 [Chitinivibrionales bacterium]|nr:hypothetical protein [Chitinivibrionales bacterium]MBD3395955.1 hypothetical protein [Chitinivibrionales bacterium]